jgi:hypothetical protein
MNREVRVKDGNERLWKPEHDSIDNPVFQSWWRSSVLARDLPPSGESSQARCTYSSGSERETETPGLLISSLKAKANIILM